MYDNFEFYKNHNPVEGSTEIFLTMKDKNDGTRTHLTYDNQQFTAHKLPIGQLGVQPLFKLPWELSQKFLQAMANKLNEIGIRPEGKPVLENELTATKYHLEDMRKLVFERESI
jgi:hypothetical protein